MRVLLLLFVIGIASSKLIQVVEVFRHGSRYIIDDGFINSGELLPTGMRQHYNLGRMIRKEYIEDQPFLSPQFNHDEIRVRSTDVNRTLQSVQSQLLGIYPDGPSLPKIDQQYYLPPFKGVTNFLDSDYALPFGRQVIPVHVEPDHYQVLLPDCLNENELSRKDVDSLVEKTIQFEQATKQSRINLCEKFKVAQCNNADDLEGFYTDYISAIFEGRQVPNISKEEQLILSRFKAFSMFRDLAGPLMSKYLAQPFYYELLKIFKVKISNPYIPEKLHIYSAHDTNVIRYAAVLGLISADCLISQAENYDPNLQCQHAPDFAASMIFELHQNDTDQSYFIMVKYNGEYQQLFNDGYQLAIDIFENKVLQKLASEGDFVNTCGKNPFRDVEDDQLLTKIMVAQAFLILTLIAIAFKLG